MIMIYSHPFMTMSPLNLLPLVCQVFHLLQCYTKYMTTFIYLFIYLIGPIGVAAAAAIQTAKKRKRPHSFETNPSIRKRQQTRLLRFVINHFHLLLFIYL